MKNMIRNLIGPAVALFTLTALGQQGAVRMLYTVPNTTFIESKSGDHAVTINDASGSISSLQTAINNARSANPTNVLIIHLLRGATYTVTTNGLVLGSHECLVGTGAMIQAANSSVTVPLITIATGANNVSVAGGTLSGNSASINAITGTSVDRVNIDNVTVAGCGLDGILLKGNGNTTYDNEITVTRCDVSWSSAHAGISIQNATQAAIYDNDCHDNNYGIYVSCAWADVANNTCENNVIGIYVTGGDDNVIANNTCNNNGTGIRAGGTKNMIVSNATGNNSTAGIASAGTSNNFIDNLFTSGNTVNFSNGGATDNVIAYKTAISGSGQNYFYPPLIDNQHTNTTIVNGRGRTDVTISSTSIDSVQSQYNTARANNPNDVIVLHLNGTFPVGATPLTIESNTCVLLNGTIQVNASTTANTAIQAGNSPNNISLSGGTVDGGNLTGNTAISMYTCTCAQIDNMTIQNFGDPNTRVTSSDLIHFSGGTTPIVVTRCYLNGGAARGIWTQLSSQKALISDNEVANVNQDGVDLDSTTFGAVVKFNYLHDNIRCGVFIEQSANHDLALGNICNNNEIGVNCYNNYATPRAATMYNSVIANACLGATGLRNGSTGDGTNVVTAHNFYFDNTLVNADILSQVDGTENYYSQNYQTGGSITFSGAESFFNSTDVDGNFQILDSNSGLGVVVQNGATTNSAPVITANPVSLGNGTGNDEWKFVPTDSGFYKIVNKKSGLAMVVAGASLSTGAPIIQYAYSSGTTYNDEWQIQSAGNGFYSFVNRLSALTLDVTGASQNPGTQLEQWTGNGHANQQFTLIQDGFTLGSPDFTVNATTISQTVMPGGVANFNAGVTPTNGFNNTVTFSVSGLPAGATATFSPTSVTGSGSTTLSVTTATSTPGGSYTLTITGTSGTLSRSDTATLVVSDFSVASTTSSQATVVGGNANYTVNLGNLNGFSGSISLSAAGVPAGATASFNPASLAAPGSSTMTVATATAAVGDYTLTITGTSGSLAHSTNVNLSVTDFSVAATAPSAVAAGSSTTSTATVSAINGFNGTVTWSASGLPTGATASFSPASVTGAGSSTLMLNTAPTTPAGNYTVTVTGTSSGVAHSTTITLSVTDFSVAATTPAAVQAGSSTTSTATLGAINGFGGTVTWSVSGLPSGATGTFNPTTITGAGSSTLTINTSTTTPAGNYTVTVTGTIGGLSHSTTITLSVTDFSVAATPASQTVNAGSNTTYTATATALNGFSGTINWSVSGLPTGATGSFNPASVAGSGSSTLTVTTSTSTPGGASTLTITGTSGSLTRSANVTLVVNGSAPTNLPAGWSHTDIGAVGVAGSAGYLNNTYTVSGSGADIWNTGDQFQFAYQPVTNDLIITARVATETGTASYAKAGVMVRESTATNAIEVSVLLTPTNGVAMQIRQTTGAGSINVAGWIRGSTPPTWVRLVRSGNTFSSYQSADGVTWTLVASTNVTMATTAKAGLAVTSHDNTSLNTATFDNVSIASTATLSPIADAFVRDGTYATNNFGTATNMDIKNSTTSYNRMAFLKFDLTSISSVSSAKLRLYGSFVNTNSTSPVTAHQQTNSWTETGITWTNKPAAGAAITTVNVSTNIQYWEWDITSYVQAQKTGGATQISIQLQNDTGTPQSVTLNSREAPANKPQLVVTP